jgi:hypothetical protein
VQLGLQACEDAWIAQGCIHRLLRVRTRRAQS